MNIVVECACQVSYEFDVEPVDGKMPGTVACPSCGADGTEYANRVIQETLEKERAAKPKITFKRPAEEEAPPVEQPGVTDDGPGLPKFCYFHKDQPMDGFCLTCKKPICRKCMKQSGYFCSPYCRGRAEAQGLDIPEYEGHERIARVREYERVAQITKAVLIGLLVLFIAYEWYQIWGHKPSVKFTLPVPGNEYTQKAQFISSRELLLINPDKISVVDFKAKHEIWTKSLAAYRPQLPTTPAVASTGDASGRAAIQSERQRQLVEQREAYQDYYDRNISAHVAGNDIWVTQGRNILGFDRATGAEKTKIRIEGRIQHTAFADDVMLIVSAKGMSDYILTRIELSSGKQLVERRSLPERPAGEPDPDALTEGGLRSLFKPHEFLPAGTTVAAVDVKLIEKNIVSVQTMKAAQPEKFSKELRASQSREFAEDVFNEMKRMRSGGVARVDQSRYAVTLQRVFGKDATPWTGEVTGPPVLFALKTVDVLVAGKVLYVFDRSNHKLWESTLSYPIAQRFTFRDNWGAGGEREPAKAPCVERGDALCFFDQGVLTAFDIQSGAVRWRMPSVGVSRIQFDDKGMLYVTTTSASPESIQYSEEVNFTNPAEPVVEKVDPTTGKILWRVQKIGDECYLAGKYVYLTSANAAPGLTMSSRTSNFGLYRLNPKNGKQLWEFSPPASPVAVDFQDNEILFLFHDKLEVLKFLSL